MNASSVWFKRSRGAAGAFVVAALVVLKAGAVTPAIDRGGDASLATPTPAPSRPLDRGSKVNQPQSVAHLESLAVVELGEKPARIVLQPIGAPRTLAARRRAMSPGRRLHLVLRGVRAEIEPGTLFHIYLDLPEGVSPRADDPRRVGMINFYGAIRDAGEEGGAGSLSRSFDITDLVDKLQQAKLLTGDTTFTIIASRPVTLGARASIARAEVVEQ